jgi:hypothetical protein
MQSACLLTGRNRGGINKMAAMSATVHFSIKYDGPALTSHQMDVRELAPALIALSDLLEEANKAAFADAPPVRVNVQGNFKGGSFGIDLIAVQSVKEQLVSLLSGPESTAVANLFGILGGIGLVASAGGGLIQVIRWLKGRKPNVVRFEGEKTVFELHMSEHVETLEVDLVAGRLYQSRVVRQALAKVIKPLEREGIDTFASGADGVASVIVTKEDVASFESAAGDAEVVSDTVAKNLLLLIESAVFKDGNKWRFNDGSAAFFAEITDETFLAKIEAGERFGKGDVLIVDLRRVQSVSDNGLKAEHEIVRVHEHRSPLQAPLALKL